MMPFDVFFYTTHYNITIYRYVEISFVFLAAVLGIYFEIFQASKYMCMASDVFLSFTGDRCCGIGLNMYVTFLRRQRFACFPSSFSSSSSSSSGQVAEGPHSASQH